MRNTAFFIAALVLLPLSGTAWAQDCPDYEVPNVTARLEFAKPHFDHSVPVSQLLQLGQRESDTGFPNHRPGEMAAGLTIGREKIAYRMQMRFVPVGQGHDCSQVTDVELTLGTSATTVLVASELPEGTCPFNAVMNHELKHVEVTQRFMQAAMPLVRAQVDQGMRYLKPVLSKTNEQDEVKAYLEKQVSDLIEPLNKKLSDSLARHQREEVDTPEEYANLDRACNGELARTLGRIKFGR